MTMQKLTAADPATRSPDLVAENIKRLKALFPELLTEGPNGAAVNVDVLKTLVGDKTVTDAEEKYGLNWHGKRRARQLALTPSTGTLRPCPEDSVDWDTTQNLMIEGDNLEVLKLLQKSYAGKVKLIYIDPPYNTGKDFVYPDNFQDSIKNYLELTGQLEGGAKISSNTEASGRFHTDWLNMMYPRLKLARDLLARDGVIFVSIDQNELAALTFLLNEVFGEENNIEIFSWVRTTTPAALSRKTKTVVEFVLCFQRSESGQQLRGIEKPAQSANTLLNQPNAVSELCFPVGIEVGFEDVVLQPGTYGSSSYTVELLEPAEARGGRLVTPLKLRARFRWSQSYLDEQLEQGVKVRIATRKLLPSYEKDSYGREAMPNLIDSNVGVGTNEDAGSEVAQLLGAKGVVSFPKPRSLLQYLINSCTADDDIVLDFFAGSGTTGDAVWALNAADGGRRRFILIQLPEALKKENPDQAAASEFCSAIGRAPNLVELTKERLRRAAVRVKEEQPLFAGDLGFRVFRLASSNFHEWDTKPTDLPASLLDSVKSVKQDRSVADVEFELLLKLGLDLCVPVLERTVSGQSGRQHVLKAIGHGVLMTCLSTRIERDDVEAIAAAIVDWRRLLGVVGDTTCVFMDAAFPDDVSKVNLSAILKQNGIDRITSL
jgi:adenine-specific DNA-methyltransferase